MRSLLFFPACIVLCLVSASTVRAQTAASMTTPEKAAKARAEAIRVADAWLDSVQVYQHIPAISAGVVAGDDLVWSKGYGTLDADHKVPAAPDTIYSICSISKLFTSVSLMQQWEQGKVHLDEPITTYLPWAKLKTTDEDSVPITLRGLLSHSAGLPRESDFPYWSGPDFPFPTQRTDSRDDHEAVHHSSPPNATSSTAISVSRSSAKPLKPCLGSLMPNTPKPTSSIPSASTTPAPTCRWTSMASALPWAMEP